MAANSIGVDTGGTFTDFVLVRDGVVSIEKLPSTPGDPSRAILEGVAILPGTTGVDVVHGSTVALNAVLTGNTARTGLVTGKGFLDLIEIARQDRPELYALSPSKPRALVPRELRFEIRQRSAPGPNGALEELHSPDEEELARLLQSLQAAELESLAICLLHSYADPSIEERIAESLTELGIPVTCSAQILPEYREYERFSTAIANAALVPVMQQYLAGLERGLVDHRLDLMQSSGGTIAADRAAKEPVRVLFSGPAGGVIGAARAARESGFESIVALDMGGTSTDVAFHSQTMQSTLSETRIAGHPIAVPALDIHTIGTGGGSLVSVDEAGILHVGPESAAADPGPVCYGKGKILTVTDAHVQLGHIATGSFASGRIEIDGRSVNQLFAELGARLEVTAHEAAQAVLDVARAAMRRAIGVMTMQRGQDPKRLPLVAFGGAGGLHGASLAGSLEMPGALIPAHPGVLSAWGMAHADALCDRSKTVLGSLAEWTHSRRAEALSELLGAAAAELRAAGHAPDSIVGETSLDLRYHGQNSSLALSDEGASSEELGARFHAQHESLYGWCLEENAIELVNLRARARVPHPVPAPQTVEASEVSQDARLGHREAWFDGPHEVLRLNRESLKPGNVFTGPALLEEQSGTGLVPPGWTARVLSGGHLWLANDVSR